MSKSTLIDEYFDYQNEFEKKYGEKTIVLMEVGGFFELYGNINDDFSEGRIQEVCDLTNLTMSKKCDKLQPVSRKNPLMAGFPSHSFDKWKEILLKHDYTIIKIEQDSHGRPGHATKPNRKITEIISPAMNLESDNFSTFTMSIYLEQIKDHSTNRPLLFVGITLIDVATGETIVYETHSNPDDYKLSLDEIFRFIQSYNPPEILFQTLNLPMEKEEMMKYLELGNQKIHWNYYVDDKLLKPINRDTLLKGIFNCGLLNPVEYLDLEKMPFALNSYIFIINFIYEHNENFIQKLSKPTIWTPSNYLILSHDSIAQLNVVPDKNRVQKSKINSLWSVLDNTITSMGRRQLYNYLTNPILDKDTLEKRYELISQLRLPIGDDKVKLFEKIRSLLKNINDIERLHRRMAVRMMNPSSFIGLDLSYQNILKLVDYLKSLGNPTINTLIPDEITLQQFGEFIEDYNSKIDFNGISNINLNNITRNIFRKGLYPELDEIQAKLDNIENFTNGLSLCLSKLIDNTTKTNILDCKSNDRDGIYIVISPSKLKGLKPQIDKMKDTLIYYDSLGKVFGKDLEFKSLSGSTKISCELMNKLSHAMVGYELKIGNLCLEVFSNLILDYYVKYDKVLAKIVDFVANIDVLSNGAMIAYNNGYCMPKIKIASSSYMIAKELRHPIIEIIQEGLQYVPNDITLGTINENGDQQNCILLFGVNAAGKSSLMKAIGLNIIMAQMGYWVSAKEFTYSPYKYLFTRISNHDNLFKGQSTFAVEMAELRSILKRANNHSLVLGDELCSGTETTSGLSIVATGVNKLAKKNVSFLLATHLHQLPLLEEVKELGNVHCYHLETMYDEKTKKLIYNRKLKTGSGNPIYGLEVARAMDLDSDFLEMANKIRRRIMGIEEKMVSEKVSQYNSKLLISKCNICGNETEEVHHIKEQHLANSDGMIDNFHKNNLFNLVQLCHNCHHEVHHGNLQIDGYVMTSNGIELQHHFIENKKEINEEKSNEIEIEEPIKEPNNESGLESIKIGRMTINEEEAFNIRNWYKRHKNYSLVRTLFETKIDKKIPIETIKKIINNSNFLPQNPDKTYKVFT